MNIENPIENTGSHSGIATTLDIVEPLDDR
jgi:hypothetical protein